MFKEFLNGKKYKQPRRHILKLSDLKNNKNKT